MNLIELMRHLLTDHHWKENDTRWWQSKAKLEQDHRDEHETGFPHESLN